MTTREGLIKLIYYILEDSDNAVLDVWLTDLIQELEETEDEN